jgi:hypothetical protein
MTDPDNVSCVSRMTDLKFSNQRFGSFACIYHHPDNQQLQHQNSWQGQPTCSSSMSSSVNKLIRKVYAVYPSIPYVAVWRYQTAQPFYSAKASLLSGSIIKAPRGTANSRSYWHILAYQADSLFLFAYAICLRQEECPPTCFHAGRSPRRSHAGGTVPCRYC